MNTCHSLELTRRLGARIFGAHDVRQTRQALDMVASIKGDRTPLRLARALA